MIVAVEVHDNPDEQRFEAAVEGELAGFAAYRAQPGLIAFVPRRSRIDSRDMESDRCSYAKPSKMPAGEALRFSRSVRS